jgi:hypothetical protein
MSVQIARIVNLKLFTTEMQISSRYGQQHDRLVLSVKYSSIKSVLYGEVNNVENLHVKFDSIV